MVGRTEYRLAGSNIALYIFLSSCRISIHNEILKLISKIPRALLIREACSVDDLYLRNMCLQVPRIYIAG